jgi:hypothetical protein
MDGPGDLVARLRTALAAFDDEALAALANKGLVRRARKDLESAMPKVLAAEGDRLRLQVEDATVAVDPTPSRSTCSCPATGICRHILGALMFLREAPGTEGEGTKGGDAKVGPATAAPSAAEEMVIVTDEELAKWAGKALVGRAARALRHGLVVEFEEAGAILAQFLTRNVTCRWMPGGGLAGMVCSCHAPEACEHKVAAVLAYQVASGRRTLDDVEPAALDASAGAPRTRAEVLDSVSDVARKLVALGTTRLSRATAERLRTLAVSAHGVDLPRLERMLRGLADEVQLGLARAAQADAAALLARTAQVEALAHALRTRPAAHLIGEHRTSYEPVGSIEVVGLGARRWRARSGYEGLTVYFWDRSAGRWATWTEARPLTTGGLDPATRYHEEGPWSGVDSPASASRKALRLTGAYRNRSGRLSGRPSTRTFALAPADSKAIPARLDRWAELAERARQLFGGGFRDRNEQDEIVLLAPAGWGAPEFDPIRQEIVRVVSDADGRPLPLVLRHTPETQGAVDALEAHDPSDTHTVLGLLRLDGDRLYVEPISLHGAKGVFNLTLETARRTSRPRPIDDRAAPETEEDSDGDEEDTPPAPSSTRLGGLLDALASHLETIGEGGFAAFRSIGELRGLGARAEAIGLSSCARSVGRVVERLEQQRRGERDDPDLAARDVLRAYHIIRLAAAQEAVASATLRLAIHTSSESASSAACPAIADRSLTTSE